LCFSITCLLLMTERDGEPGDDETAEGSEAACWTKFSGFFDTSGFLGFTSGLATTGGVTLRGSAAGGDGDWFLTELTEPVDPATEYSGLLDVREEMDLVGEPAVVGGVCFKSTQFHRVYESKP
jgi:hypothetical protein